MSQESVEMFLGRLITDDNFRKLTQKAFIKASTEQGFSLTAEERKILQEIDFGKFVCLSNELDNRIKRCSRFYGNY